jgi:hypothetical protein
MRVDVSLVQPPPRDDLQGQRISLQDKLFSHHRLRVLAHDYGMVMTRDHVQQQDYVISTVPFATISIAE